MHAVRRPPEPFAAMGGRLIVHTVPAGADNLCFIAACALTGDAVVVDGPDADAVLSCADAHGLRIVAVVNTHTHGDHVGINRDLDRRGLLGRMRVIGPRAVAADVPGLTEPVDEGDSVRFGAIEGRVMRTDGHLDGHVSYVFGDVLFCGDTLFTGGCGYLFSGPPEVMFRSLLRLAALDPETHVCCAHEYTQDNLRFAWSVEPDNAALAERIRRVWAIRADGGCAVPSTIAEERATNPFLRPGAPTLRARVAASMPGADLGRPDLVFAATRALKDRKLYRALPDSELPLP